MLDVFLMGAMSSIQLSRFTFFILHMLNFTITDGIFDTGQREALFGNNFKVIKIFLD